MYPILCDDRKKVEMFLGVSPYRQYSITSFLIKSDVGTDRFIPRCHCRRLTHFCQALFIPHISQSHLTSTMHLSSHRCRSVWTRSDQRPRTRVRVNEILHWPEGNRWIILHSGRSPRKARNAKSPSNHKHRCNQEPMKFWKKDLKDLFKFNYVQELNNEQKNANTCEIT